MHMETVVHSMPFDDLQFPLELLCYVGFYYGKDYCGLVLLGWYMGLLNLLQPAHFPLALCLIDSCFSFPLSHFGSTTPSFVAFHFGAYS